MESFTILVFVVLPLLLRALSARIIINIIVISISIIINLNELLLFSPIVHKGERSP